MANPRSPTPSNERSAADSEVVRAFYPEATEVRPLAGRNHLLLAETPGGRRVVRRWPEDAPDARVEATVSLVGRLAAAGLPVPIPDTLPDGGAVLRHDGHPYDARAWLPGATAARAAVAYPDPERWLDLPVALPERAFAEAIRLLARLHQETTPPPPLALPAAPLTGLPVAVRSAWSDLRGTLRPLAPRTPPVQRWIAAGERLLPAAQAALAAGDPSALASSALAPAAVVHLNAWPGHLLLGEEDEVTGLIGWEHAAVGTPLLDLAQAIVRLRGWGAAAVEETVAAQGDIAPLAPELRRLLPAVAGLDLVATAGRLLVAAYAPGPEAPAAPVALRQAAARLVEAMDTAAGSLAQADATSAAPRRTRPRRRPTQGPKGRRR